MPQPLPAELPKHFNTSAEDAESAIRPAYSRILLLERAAHSNTNHEIHEQKLVHARVLGYLIVEGPSMQASEFVAREVNACQSEDQLDEMGGMYLHRFFRAIRKYRSITPPSSPSSHPSSPISFETKKEMVEYILRQLDEPQAEGGELEPRNLRHRRLDHVPGRQHGDFEAKARKNFTSFSHRLLLYGMTFGVSFLGHTILDLCAGTASSRRKRLDPARRVADVHGSADISGLDAVEDGATTGSGKHSASVCAITKCFGYEDLPEKLIVAGGTTIHGLDNVMTLEPSIRAWFEALELWFEAIGGEENTYAIRAIDEILLLSCKENPITFKSTHANLPLPNPAYLRIHAACCRIAHLSGAGEYMRQMLEDLEDTHVLSKDGSSAHVLSLALQPYS